MNNNLPCENCIVLAICRNKIRNVIANLDFFMAVMNCCLLEKYCISTDRETAVSHFNEVFGKNWYRL